MGASPSGASAGLAAITAAAVEQLTITRPRQVAPCASSIDRMLLELWKFQAVQKR